MKATDTMFRTPDLMEITFDSDIKTNPKSVHKMVFLYYITQNLQWCKDFAENLSKKNQARWRGVRRLF